MNEHSERIAKRSALRAWNKAVACYRYRETLQEFHFRTVGYMHASLLEAFRNETIAYQSAKALFSILGTVDPAYKPCDMAHGISAQAYRELESIPIYTPLHST